MTKHDIKVSRHDLPKFFIENDISPTVLFDNLTWAKIELDKKHFRIVQNQDTREYTITVESWEESGG